MPYFHVLVDFVGFIGTIVAKLTLEWLFSCMNHEMTFQIGTSIKDMLANRTDELTLPFQRILIQCVSLASKIRIIIFLQGHKFQASAFQSGFSLYELKDLENLGLYLSVSQCFFL